MQCMRFGTELSNTILIRRLPIMYFHLCVHTFIARSTNICWAVKHLYSLYTDTKMDEDIPGLLKYFIWPWTLRRYSTTEYWLHITVWGVYLHIHTPCKLSVGAMPYTGCIYFGGHVPRYLFICESFWPVCGHGSDISECPTCTKKNAKHTSMLVQPWMRNENAWCNYC